MVSVEAAAQIEKQMACDDVVFKTPWNKKQIEEHARTMAEKRNAKAAIITHQKVESWQ